MKPQKQLPPLLINKTLRFSDVESLGGKLLTRDFLEIASQLISSKQQPSSFSNFNSSWAQWVGWCNDPFPCDINQAVIHLSCLFDAGLEYRTTGCHRSPISGYHGYIDGKPVGQHLTVCTLLKGLFKQRPPQPHVHSGCTNCAKPY